MNIFLEMASKRKQTSDDGDGDDGEDGGDDDDDNNTKRSSTVVMGINAALTTFSSATKASQQQVDLLKGLIRDCVAKTSKVAVLASWLLNVYLAAVPDAWVENNPGIVNIDQAKCLAACGLVNGLGHARTGSSQPTMTAFFELHFRPRFPDGIWPRLSPTGNALHALAKEMAVNYGVYMDTGLHAHAISHLRVVLGLNKATARKLWKRAVRSAEWERRQQAPAAANNADDNGDDEEGNTNPTDKQNSDDGDGDDDGDDDDDEEEGNTNPTNKHNSDDGDSDDDSDDGDHDHDHDHENHDWANRWIIALNMARRYLLSPFLFHRWLLQQVEERHQQRADGHLPPDAKLGNLFPLVPQRKIRTHFATFDTQVRYVCLFFYFYFIFFNSPF